MPFVGDGSVINQLMAPRMCRLPIMYPCNARLHKSFAEHFLYMMVRTCEHWR